MGLLFVWIIPSAHEMQMKCCINLGAHFNSHTHTRTHSQAQAHLVSHVHAIHWRQSKETCSIFEFRSTVFHSILLPFLFFLLRDLRDFVLRSLFLCGFCVPKHVLCMYVNDAVYLCTCPRCCRVCVCSPAKQGIFQISIFHRHRAAGNTNWLHVLT